MGLFARQLTFFCPALDEEVNLNGLSPLCPKRQDQREATSQREAETRRGEWAFLAERTATAGISHSVGKSMCRVSLCRTRTANTNEILCCSCEGKGGGGVSEICLQGPKEVSTLPQETGAGRER